MSSRSDTLHCIVRSAADSAAGALVMAMARPGDSVLWMQDGVFALPSPSMLPEGVRGHVLVDDLSRRGLDSRLPDGFVGVDAAGFVRLCAAHARQVCWA